MPWQKRSPWLSRPRAYVTLLASDGDWVMPVVAQAKGLKKVKSKYPLVVAVLPNVSAMCRQILKMQGCKVRQIQPVGLPNNWTQFMTADHVSKYSKLCIWQFVEYSKMVYLENGMQVFDNIDHLFDKEDGYIYAVLDCFCEETWIDTPQYKIGYCQQCPNEVQWRDDLGPPPPLYFNDGMFVFEPSLATYNNLLNTLRTAPRPPFSPQHFLNEYFRNIYKLLDREYNLPLSMLWRHPVDNLEKVKVVHYCEADWEPWKYNEQDLTDNAQIEDIQMQARMLVKKWRDICDDETLDSKSWMGGLRKSLSRSQLWS